MILCSPGLWFEDVPQGTGCQVAPYCLMAGDRGRGTGEDGGWNPVLSFLMGPDLDGYCYTISGLKPAR
jgi:hypothetical protein